MQEIDEFLKVLEAVPDVETKLQKAIDFMQAAISQAGVPHFKNFWEAKNLCQALFKEPVSPAVRPLLFEKYQEISREGQRLKNLLDEESAFACEQIEMAIKAVESDLNRIPELILTAPQIDYPFCSTTIEPNRSFYDDRQKELNILNATASKINALRKELIKQEMRVRQKNQFFQRLSVAGDKVFPRRKDLIKEVSDAFEKDVANFIQTHFQTEEITHSLSPLRDEIRALQSIAKIYTLNTHAFNQVRNKLCDCWDLIKKVEKERKVEWQQKLEAQKLKAQEKQQAIQNEEREALRQKEIEKEREQARAHLYLNLKGKIDALSQEASHLEAKVFKEKYDALVEEQRTHSFSKKEKQSLQSSFSALKDLVAKKREEEILERAGSEADKLIQLKKLLEERLKRRKEIKDQVELYRVTKGSSASHFDQAWTNVQLLNAQKERLLEIDNLIREVKDQIESLEAALKI